MVNGRSPSPVAGETIDDVRERPVNDCVRSFRGVLPKFLCLGFDFETSSCITKSQQRTTSTKGWKP